jgi:hypothetical protein
MVAMIVLSVVIPKNYIKYTWLLNMALLTMFVVITGLGVTGRLSGVLIDSRNRWNLSRLQMILWTIVILSGFFTIAIWNVFSGQSDPLSIAMQEELWLLMGISTTSLVASPLILNNKREKKPEPSETNNVLMLLSRQRGVDLVMDDKDKAKQLEELPVEADGQLVKNKDIKDAGAIDLFKGEETGNATHLDLGRIQMLYFTVITIIAYAVTLYQGFSEVAKTGDKIAEFPILSSSMIGLLAISHGGYLVHKAIPHSKTDTQQN